MKYWIRFLKEKRAAAGLYAGMVFLFVAVGSLYHIENLNKLLYAALLAAALWIAAGIKEGRVYVRKSRALENVARHFEQCGEVVMGEIFPEQPGRESDVREAETLEEDFLILLKNVCGRWDGERRHWEEKAADQDDYYVMWAHQIKTPISAMKLLLEDGGQYKDNFLMQEELFKIEQYVEMVLTFRRLEKISSDLVLQEYELEGMLRQAARKYSVLFINRRLSLELPDTHTKVLTDEKWFGLCLEQLFSNSIKYTKEGKISVFAEEGPQNVKVVLEDTGIGIRQEDLPRIFEKGFTGYNGRLDKRATGIGLYLCRRIFDHLSIQVNVESEEGRGTRVTLLLPVRRVNSNGILT